MIEDAEVFTRKLEDKLGSGVEVLNFGISSLGTVQEEILYEGKVAAYKPDIVLLSVYMNDVSNNDPVLEGGPDKATRLTYRDADGNIVRYQAQTSTFFSVRKWLRLHSAVFRLVKSIHRIARAAMTTHEDAPSVPKAFPSQYLVFGPPQNANWIRGWSATEAALLRLKASMGPNQQFFFFTAPSVVEVASDATALLKEEFGVEPPAFFDVSYFHDRLLSFAVDHGIRTLDLQSGFEAYIREHDLQYPYFSRTCDGHWAALGHEVAAELLAQQLRSVVMDSMR